ncbi:MAG TPA: tRNA pseudouridine(54/55) synthase Pus10 [Thermoplasmata archaeon]|nr:tRNA pseudouridine(54/55) synthase Pus10 [Thermoplasmata archaeon]
MEKTGDNEECGGVFRTAGKMFKEGYVCDRCLGRQFSALCCGMGNLERGRSIKNYFMLCREGNKAGFEGMHLDYGEGEVCWVCGGLFNEVDEWARMCIERSVPYEYNSFLAGTHLSEELFKKEEYIREKIGVPYAESIKADLNREVGKRICELSEKEPDFENPDIVFTLDIPSKKVKLSVRSVFIYGRYKKYVRGIPQTKWPCRKCGGRGCERCGYTGKMYGESVEEIIAEPFLKVLEGSNEKFHGAGREDIDVRMLGNGRPFILEIKEPKRRTIDLKKIEEEINKGSKVGVSELGFADKEEVIRIKSWRANKTYRCEVEFEREVGEKEIRSTLEHLKGVSIKQRTPTRVLHRRGDLVRERKVHEVKLLKYKKKSASFEIKCEGGTYIKELINGDSGRTKPSLSEMLGVDSKVKELDVTGFEDSQASKR